MKKGPAYHWDLMVVDLMVVAVLNAVLAYFGLPMVHGALPHSEHCHTRLCTCGQWLTSRTASAKDTYTSSRSQITARYIA